MAHTLLLKYLPRSTPLIQRIIIWVVLLGLFGCSPETPPSLNHFLAEPQISAPPEYLECAKLVNRHVLATRSWDESVFNVSFDGINLQFNSPIFRVSHIDDYRVNRGEVLHLGSGNSFFVVADCANMKIIKELKMQ